MRAGALWLGLLVAAGQLNAAERRFDFSQMATNAVPSNCFSLLAGEGKPGDWRVLMDEVPLGSLTPEGAPRLGPKHVVAQLAKETTDEHFPILMLGNEVYWDFTFTTRFKIVDGQTEQMAGIAFRIQDERNFYVVRASALGSNVTYYKVTDGVRGQLFKSDVHIPEGEWQELSVECAGNRIIYRLNGKNLISYVEDSTQNAFAKGRIGFWTKSDSVSYFADARISYTPRETFAQKLVQDMMKEYPRLLGLQVFAVPPDGAGTRLIASNDSTTTGGPGEKSDLDVIQRGVAYYRKEKTEVVVTMPLRDRNGDPMAAVRIRLKPVIGQTEDNARERAVPIIREMQLRAAAAGSLVD